MIPIRDRIAEILLNHDPMKIYFAHYDNRDEYVREAKDIAARSKTANWCLPIYERFGHPKAHESHCAVSKMSPRLGTIGGQSRGRQRRT
jgi:hypothetical protein